MDLVEETGLTKGTVRKYLNALWNHKVVRIAAWEAARDGRRVVAVYKIGVKEDAKQPRMTDAERKARYKARKAAEKQRLLEQAWKEAA